MVMMPKLKRAWVRYLTSIYYRPDSPASYTSLDKLWSHIKSRGDKPVGLTQTVIKQWLLHQDTASVHKPSRTRFPRERIIVSAIDQSWDADLADLSQLKEENDNVTFILVMIDLLSRYCWLRGLKSKKAKDVKDAIQDVFQEGRIPGRLRTDLGTEFTNKLVRSYLESKGVHYYSTYSETKANYSERLIRTIKGKLFKYMYDKQSLRYIDVLQDIAASYNNTEHRSIGVAPSQVTKDNDLDLYMRVYMPYVNKTAKKQPQFSFNIGDTVRVAYKKETFSRSYNEQFSEELFTVTHRIPSTPPRYILVDGLGDKIQGSFYGKELMLVPEDKHREYKIQEIVKYRKLRNGRREALIKWYGYDERYNSWIPTAQVKTYSSPGSKDKRGKKKKKQ